MRRIAALTLFEILIVLAVMAAISFPLYLSYVHSQANQSLRSSAEQLADTMRRAHVFSREARDSKEWGVKNIDSKTYALVAGSSGTIRQESQIALEPLVTFPSDFAVWFDIGSGDAKEAYSVTLQNTYGLKTSIIVNKTGVVEVVKP
jgi:Tfp pilus assembly protein FimT